MEICIINPYASAISNEKIKNCALTVIDKNSSIFVNNKQSKSASQPKLHRTLYPTDYLLFILKDQFVFTK